MGVYFSQTSLIYFWRGFSCCPYYRGVRYSWVSAGRELTVLTKILFESLWLWRWQPHRLSKRQSLSTTTVLFRTTFTRTIKLNQLLKWLLGTNLSQKFLSLYESLAVNFYKVVFWTSQEFFGCQEAWCLIQRFKCEEKLPICVAFVGLKTPLPL